MKKWSCITLVVTGLVTGSTFLIAQSQGPQQAVVVVPDSTVERLTDVGIRAYTNHLILLRPEFVGTSPSGETPQTMETPPSFATSPPAPRAVSAP